MSTKKVRRTFFQIRVKSEELRVKDEIRPISRISTIYITRNLNN